LEQAIVLMSSNGTRTNGQKRRGNTKAVKGTEWGVGGHVRVVLVEDEK